MCERLVIADQDDVEREVSVTHRWWTFSPRFNVAPSQSVPITRLYKGESEGVMMRWGFVPASAKGEMTRTGASCIGSGHIEKSADYAGPWLYGQRCIVPLAGFYVWHLAPQRHRQPYYVRLVNRQVFGVAALWDRTVTDDDDVIEGCAVITVSANSLMAELDDRKRQMPAILRREHYHKWLTATPAQAKTLLQTYPGERMLTHPVRPHVNFLQFDDPLLLRPIL